MAWLKIFNFPDARIYLAAIMPKWPKSQMPSSLHGVFSFVLYLQFEVAVPTGKGGRGVESLAAQAGAFNDGRAISIEEMSIRAVQEK
jgi:hypothetical protein